MRRRNPEAGAPLDTGVASSRDTGGKPNPAYPDQHTTTGTTPDQEFVGRVSGEDPGDAEETGAERRAQDSAGPG